MKHEILLNHIAQKTNSNIKVFNNKNECVESYGKLIDSNLLNKDIQKKVYSLVSKNKPLLFSVNDKYYYSSIIFDEGAILFGPIHSPYFIRLQNSLNFKTKYNDEKEIKEGSLVEFFDSTILINNMLNDADLDYNNFLYNNFFNESLNEEVNKRMREIRYEFNEENREHDTHEREKRLVNAISTGDVKLITSASMENIKGSHGTVSKDQLENDKILAIVGITIASRAALNAGILSEVVLTLTDTYIQELTKAKDSSQIESIVYNCNLHLTRLVQEYLSSNTDINENISNYYSKKAKLYISNHLHNPIKTSNIAAELKISPNYLSNLFKQSEGITLTEYILKEKVTLAKSMLLYSDANNLEIASTLSFSSQSHFCKVFKKYTNTTPAEFKKNLK